MWILFTVLQAHQIVCQFAHIIAFLGRTAPALQQSKWVKYELKTYLKRNMQMKMAGTTNRR